MQGYNPKFLTNWSSQSLPTDRQQMQFMFKNFLRYKVQNVLSQHKNMQFADYQEY